MIRLCSGPPQTAEEIADYWPSVEFFTGSPSSAAAGMADGDIVAWLDPGIMIVSSIPSFVIPHLIKDADLCFCGFENGRRNLSFWAARLNESSRRFLAALAATDDAEPVWAVAESEFGARVRDLAPGGFGGVWGHGPLGRYTRRA